MDMMQSLWLGLVQGLTEFLPVSSSGHLVLLQKLFGITTSGAQFEAFSVLLHAGTLLAVLVVYWRRIWNMICHPIRSELLLIIVATLPTVAAALLFDFDEAFEGEYLGFSFLMTTLILWLADLVGGLAPKRKQAGWGNAITMGVLQAVAIMPGISRSGATISGGVATGLSRKRAADFAFLMSIPAILGSIVLSFMNGNFALIPQLFADSLTPVLVGAGAALVAGLLAILLMLAILRRVRLTWFGLYTGVLGVLILLDQYLFHYIF